MKLDSPNVVEVTMQSEEATTVLRTKVCEASESAEKPFRWTDPRL